jgi:hypothetical protein
MLEVLSKNTTVLFLVPRHLRGFGAPSWCSKIQILLLCYLLLTFLRRDHLVGLIGLHPKLIFLLDCFDIDNDSWFLRLAWCTLVWRPSQLPFERIAWYFFSSQGIHLIDRCLFSKSHTINVQFILASYFINI